MDARGGESYSQEDSLKQQGGACLPGGATGPCGRQSWGGGMGK